MPSIKDLIILLKPERFIGNELSHIENMASIEFDQLKPTDLIWINERNIEKLSSLRNLSIICSVNTPENLLHESCNYILVTNPRQAFQKVLTAFFVKEIPTSFIAPNASIHASAKICASAFIGYNTVIEENCEIGEHVYIGHNNVICANTKIANHVKIGNNNTIGGVGFGYEKNESNAYELIPHIGNVVMEDYVEIGNNTCIDRAVLGSTRLKAHAKVDNLVHIAHGVVIGNNSLVIANAMVAGSTKVGDHVWIAPSASILNKVNIGNHVTIGMGAVVLKDVDDNSIMIGNPAKPLERKK